MACIYIAPLSKALYTLTHQLAAMQGTNQLVRSNWGLGVLFRDTSTRPGWDQTGNPPTARRQSWATSPPLDCHGFSLSDFSLSDRISRVPGQGFALLCQLVVSPGILPGRLISASFPQLGATSSLRVYTSTELVYC